MSVVRHTCSPLLALCATWPSEQRKSAPPLARAPGQMVEVVIRSHCHYEIHPGRPHSLVLARPLSQAAEAWMAQRGKDEERVVCPEYQEAEAVQGVERAIDVAFH